MKGKRAGLAALLGFVFLLVAVEPAAAQSTSSTTTEQLIWGLNSKLIYAAVPITVLVEGILIYTVWKFRKNDEAKPTKENRRLEITWTIATAIILLFVGAASYQVLGNPYVSASSTHQLDTQQQPKEIQVYAQRYSWSFHYPEEDINTTGTVVIPSNRTVELNVTSKDWLHSFHVPGLGLKQDAFPGEWHAIKTKATETGEYQLYCAEYCGSGHSQMLGTVKVVSPEEYDKWVQEQKQSGSSGNASSNSSSNSTSE